MSRSMKILNMAKAQSNNLVTESPDIHDNDITNLEIVIIDDNGHETVLPNYNNLDNIPASNVLNEHVSFLPAEDRDDGILDDNNLITLPVVDGNKKRKRNRDYWSSTENKLLREKGASFCGRKRNEDGTTWNYDEKNKERQIKMSCHCKLSLKEKTLKCRVINEEQRKDIFKKFWDMSWGEKRLYIRILTKVVVPQRARDRKRTDKSRRSASLEYHLKIGNELLRVCKKMFLHTLDIGEWTVVNWTKNKSQKNIHRVADDNLENIYEENKTAPKKKKEKEVKNLVQFYEELPKMESHYCRASTKKLYLEPIWKSKSDLYDFYKKDRCQQKAIKPVSLSKFKEVFNEKNLGLFTPKKDQCDICAGHKLGNVDETRYKIHMERKEEARAEKSRDKDSEVKTFTLDLQAVLLAPKNNVSTMYYKTKLAVHNMTFFDLQTKDGFCFIWNESEGKLSADEFSSILIHLLMEIKETLQQKGEVILYSDGCNYQNRNSTLSNALLNFAMLTNITVYQKYLERGHTQMEVDGMHSTIERKLKGTNINVPADYAVICRRERKLPKPYKVTYLDHHFFKSFKPLKFLSSIRPGKKSGDPTVTDIRALKYDPEGSVHYKLRLAEEWDNLPCRINKSKIVPIPFEKLPRLYENRIPIKTDKFNHLQTLKSVIDQDYHSFYDNIPHYSQQ